MQRKPSSMDATSTVTTLSLAKKLKQDFPDIHFKIADDPCAWTANKRQISYNEDTSMAELLHELGHALLDHSSYMRDIELLRIERDAWEYATTILGPKYNISIDEETIEVALDTYRDWLHSRSSCPNCGLNGIQDTSASYRCIQCHERWSVNDARTCQLKRTRFATKK